MDSNLGCECVRACGLTSRCRRTVNDKVLTSPRWRAAAELGRYISVSVPESLGLAHLRAERAAPRWRCLRGAPNVVVAGSSGPALCRPGPRSTVHQPHLQAAVERERSAQLRRCGSAWHIGQRALECLRCSASLSHAPSVGGVRNPCVWRRTSCGHITSRCSWPVTIKCMPRGRVMHFGEPPCARNEHRAAAELGR